jgi:hypothetical protein
LVWRVQKKQARNTLFFGPMESQASKFVCSVKTDKVLATTVRRFIQMDYCKLRVITQSDVDTADNVL